MSFDLDSARGGAPVSFSGGQYLPPANRPVRGLYIGGAGNVQLELIEDTAGGGGNIYHGPATGVIHPFQIRRIVEAGTTATNMRVMF